VELEIHTEQAFSKLRPDILSLSCLRGDPNAFTHIFPVQFIIDNMDERELGLLRQPLWITSVDMSFKLNNYDFIDGDVRGPFPILYGNEDDPKLLFDQDLMTGINEQANVLLTKIVDIYYATKLKHNLKPGEIIFIDNHRAVHGRSSFSPKYNGRDRFLIRCFISFHYEKFQYARIEGTRTYAAIYS
jgi:hypothetical protein